MTGGDGITGSDASRTPGQVTAVPVPATSVGPVVTRPSTSQTDPASDPTCTVQAMVAVQLTGAVPIGRTALGSVPTALRRFYRLARLLARYPAATPR